VSGGTVARWLTAALLAKLTTLSATFSAEQIITPMLRCHDDDVITAETRISRAKDNNIKINQTESLLSCGVLLTFVKMHSVAVLHKLFNKTTQALVFNF